MLNIPIRSSSAVTKLLIKFPTTTQSYPVVILRKMSVWQAEKDKFLTMSLKDKRTHYSTKQPNILEDIQTWKQYADSAVSLAKVIPTLPTVKIDNELNDLLSQKISIFKGDITTLEIDAIVNAANSSLLGGGGVDGAIHRAAGPNLKQECKTLNGCETGQAKITGGYKLPAKYVIHTVGPKGEKPDLLQQCYRNSLQLMSTKNLKAIAFPCISTGVYGYPVEPAAHVAVNEVRKHLEKNHSDVERVIFCIFLPEDQAVYEGVLQSYFPLV